MVKKSFQFLFILIGLVIISVFVLSKAHGASTWPNEPAGFTTITDWGLDQAVPTSGDVPISGSPSWHVIGNSLPGSILGWTVLGSDISAPSSPSSVYDFVFPIGMIEGEAPSTVYYGQLTGKEIYVGFWWKPSNPFNYGPNGNKIAFIFNGGGGVGGQQFIILKSDHLLHVLPEYPGDYVWRNPNVNSTAVTLGQWHRIEWYSNVQTGVMKYWLDGILQGSYTDVKNTFDFDVFEFSPTWGGNSGAIKQETDHYWFDHVHISKTGTSTSPPPPPTPPPTPLAGDLNLDHIVNTIDWSIMNSNWFKTW
jgi:hypothetical protein